MSAAIIACGALAADVRLIARERGWDVDVHPVPALLHNRPDRIAPQIERELLELRERYDHVAVAYGDCGSYGAIDAVLKRFAIQRLVGDHCYDVFAHAEVRSAVDEQPGTYFLTDFLARTFQHTVIRELGLDRHPDLCDEYFRHYTRVVWLAQRPTLATRAAAERAAGQIGLPLEVQRVGTERLERQLEALLSLPAQADPVGRRRS